MFLQNYIGILTKNNYLKGDNRMIKLIKRSLYLIVLTATVFSVGCSSWDFYMVKSTFRVGSNFGHLAS